MLTYEIIKNRLKKAGVRYHANDNISEHLIEGEIERLEKEVISVIRHLLNVMLIDHDHDHNTNKTAERIAKMFIREIFAGRYTEMPTITDFPNAASIDQIYTIGPISINSTCSHHFVPINGTAWLGMIPSDRVIGLSKFKRLADWVMSRPQIQEEATVQLADLIQEQIKPRGLGLIIEAKHFCMISRGVKDTNAKMTTSIMRGIFFDNPTARHEFLSLIGRQI